MDRPRRPTCLIHVTTVPTMLPFLSGQIGYMKRVGFLVRVVSSPGEHLDEFAAAHDVPADGIPMLRRIAPLSDLVSLFRLYRRFRTLRPQVVHTHTPKAGLLAMSAALLAGVPLRIYHSHGLRFMTATGLKRRLLRWTEIVSCALAHQVLCISRSVREVTVAEGICWPEKIKVLLAGSVDGIDADGQFNPERVGEEARRRARAEHCIPQDTVVLGFVGRIVRDKGLVELAEAW